MASHIEALMRKSNKFTVYKQDPDSISLLESIVNDFRTCFDPPLEPRHIGPLSQKIKHKIGRIRAELLSCGVLKKTSTGFVLAHDKPQSARSAASGDPQHRLQLEQWIQQHSPGLSWSDSDFAIDVFLLQIEHLEQRIHRETSCHDPVHIST
jgi:hypothetical protein